MVKDKGPSSVPEWLGIHNSMPKDEYGCATGVIGYLAIGDGAKVALGIAETAPDKVEHKVGDEVSVPTIPFELTSDVSPLSECDKAEVMVSSLKGGDRSKTEKSSEI